MKSGDLLVESSSLRQSEQLLSITKFGDIPITVSAHASLNYTRGVMSSDEFLMVSDSEFVSGLEAQKVIAARRITLKRDGQIIPTRHVILTFDTPVLPKKITAGYISCDIRPYIPNPVRCFKCQRFGHTKTACRVSSALCSSCSEPGHKETICQNPEKCFNCKGNHASYSKTCPKWKLEKEIQSVKVTRNISIQEARKIVHDRTPKTNHSYSAALKTIKNPDTPLEPIQTPTDTTDPKPSTSAAKNEETITVISDAKEIANVIGQTLSETSSESSYPNNFIAFKKCEEQKSVDFLPSYAEDYNSTFSYHELKDALRKSNPTSPGPDQIHNNMLKHLGESSLLTILLLFNRIWQERVFPLSWLKAIVVPIPKPGKDKQDPNNYRPIALTSCLSKLLERMVSARLMHVLERSKWFVPSQSGFRRRRNTIDNLLKL
ncbi:hypothetical protein AVEN_151655-1 [Araneus ventricosus]|uniref:CCHC-type domain-containing protein n=1 Tax=Araneus ventricosus TaxID=182803 RepID=A0A4Y2JTP1_ARAVE|nr:hypothetical protein AVEN_151655-1 [Araneus ventricosus]